MLLWLLIGILLIFYWAELMCRSYFSRLEDEAPMRSVFFTDGFCFFIKIFWNKFWALPPASMSEDSSGLLVLRLEGGWRNTLEPSYNSFFAIMLRAWCPWVSSPDGLEGVGFS